MANRTLLARNDLNSFAAWLEWRGWEIENSKSEWEALRARKPHAEHPLIVFDRLRGPCLTLQDRDVKVFQDYKRDLKALKEARRAGRI